MNKGRETQELRREIKQLKGQVRVLKEKIEAKEIKPMYCRSCKYFMQHWVRASHDKYGKGFSPLNCGHCALSGRGVKSMGSKGSPESKKATEMGCEFFEMGEYDK